jgi:hypothetical protein
LRAEYDLTGKLYLQGEFDSYIYFYPNNISDYTVSGGLYLYYKWLPKISVGVGGTFGYKMAIGVPIRRPFLKWALSIIHLKVPASR